MAADNVEANKQHFDKEAAAYEDKPFTLEWAANVDAVMQRELSSLPADAACLDFGCGECHVVLAAPFVASERKFKRLPRAMRYKHREMLTR